MYILHAVPDFASLIVHLVLEEMGVPYRLHQIDMDGDERHQPAYRALQPFGLIPALETPDGPMFETAAILLWLADRHHMLAPAPDAPERAAFLSWFTFTNNSLHTGMMDLVHAHRPAGEEVAPLISKTTRAVLTAKLAVLDRMIAEKRPGWLSPDEPSILTYYLCVLMRWMQAFPKYPADAILSRDFPAIHAILRAMETRPAALRVLAREGITTPAPFSDPPCETG